MDNSFSLIDNEFETFSLTDDDSVTEEEDNSESVDLEEISFSLDTPVLRYPCFVIEGITSLEEINYLNSKEKEEANCLPLFAFIEGEPVEIGKLEMCLDTFVTLHYIADYKLVIKKSETDVIEVDLNNPESLVKFMKL